MEAKDTVMSEEQLENIIDETWNYEESKGYYISDEDRIDDEIAEAVAKAQAEISFKAGLEAQPRTPRTDLENDLADKEYAKLYRKARIKTKREIDLCFDAHKAGYKEALEGAVIEGGYESVKKVGRREVVEYLKEDCDCPTNLLANQRGITKGKRYDCWKCRDKLKEWGTDED